MDLLKGSIKIILKYQSENGSFPASPNFENYKFCWLRDGSYIAYSLDTAGEYDAAERFYDWADETIKRYGSKVDRIIEKISSGKCLEKGNFLNARYSLTGFDEEDKGWGNFQLDGYGTWLWGLANHIKLSGREELIDKLRASIYLSIRYIENLWFYPNYDIWEENGDKIHTSTLACLYGGLNSINNILKDSEIDLLAKRIKTFILTNCVKNNKFVKYLGSSDVDSSLIWLSVPFRVVELEDKFFTNTINEIEKELLINGGLHRYKKDTYYGGGEWILLSCFLGWYYEEAGKTDKAIYIKNWAESQADENNYLTEQVCSHLNSTELYPHWVNKWGPIANPLLWSHAMYIILAKALGR